MDDKVFNLLEKMYIEMNQKFDFVNSEICSLKTDVKGIKSQLTIMDHDNKIHFEALYDGYKQSIEKITRVEKEVTKQEEIILRKVK